MFFFFKQKTAYEIMPSLVGSEMCIRDRLYPGVREALDEMLAGALQMSVLTNKPVRFSQLLVEGLGLGGYFRRVYGGNSFAQKKPDPVGVFKLLEEFGVAPGRALMV